jgi:hypothetical protein
MRYIFTFLLVFWATPYLMAQASVSWEWNVDTGINYQDIKFRQDYIFGVGNSGSEGIIIKKDTNGNTLWMNQFTGISLINLDLSSQLDVVAIGALTGSVNINGTTYTSQGDSDIIVIRCNQVGNITLVKQFGSSAKDIPIDICVDNLDGIYLAAKLGDTVMQSGNIFSGYVVSKFDSIGNPVFLHQVRADPLNPPSAFDLVAIKYNPASSSVYLCGRFNKGNIQYNKGPSASSISNNGATTNLDIYIFQISKTGQVLSGSNITATSDRTNFTTDMATNDSGKAVLTHRFQFTLNGYSDNYWTDINGTTITYLSSNANYSCNDPYGSYMYGRPLKIESDGIDFYGTIFQPSLNCNGDNCSNFYIMRYDMLYQTRSYYALNINPLSVCGHKDVFYIGSKGLHKTCATNNPVCGFTLYPAADVSVCVGNTVSIGRKLCSYIRGGSRPYTFLWQPATGLNNPSSPNPTVSGLAPGVYTYTLTITDVNNFTLYDTVNVTVSPNPVMSYIMNPNPPTCVNPIVIYPSGGVLYTYQWLDQTNTSYSQSGTDSMILNINYSTNVTVTTIDSSGCASSQSIPISLPSTINTSNLTICQSQMPYLWNGQNLSTSGVYYANFTNLIGCDSIEKLSLTVIPTDHINDSVLICPTQLPYNWQGNLLPGPGIYIDTFSGLAPAIGCDSIVTFKLKIETPIDSVSVSPSMLCGQGSANLQLYSTQIYCTPVCANSPTCISNFTFNTINNTTGGTCTAYTNYNQTSTVIAGNSYSVSISLDPYTYYPVRGRSVWIDYNHDGDFMDIGELVYTIESNSTTVTGNIVIPLTARNGLTRLRVGGKWYGNHTSCYNNTFGEYEDYTIEITGGVNSISWLPTSNLNTPFGNNVVATINTSTTYTVTAISPNGCIDSATLTIQVLPVSESIDSFSICETQLPFVWNGQNVLSTGWYVDTFMNSYGCDSITRIFVQVFSTDTIIQASCCENQLPFTLNGQQFTMSGTYFDTLYNALGCDSIVTLVLNINSIDSNSTMITICSNQLPYGWNGQQFTMPGTYFDTLSNILGCDSIVALILNINSIDSNSTMITICSNQLPHVWNGQQFTMSGTYFDTLSNVLGCDSIVALILNINSIDSNSTMITICSNQLPYVWNGQQFTMSGTYFDTLSNVLGCDSTLTLFLTVNLVDSNLVIVELCADQLPLLWNGQNITSAGLYQANYINANGCDSIERIQVVIHPLPSPVIIWIPPMLNTSLSYSSYQWLLNGAVISGATNANYQPIQNGNYVVIVTDSNTCSDSSIAYILNLLNVQTWKHFDGVYISPNPTNELAYIIFDHDFTGTIKIYNSVGQTLHSRSLQHATKSLIDLRNQSPGIYFVEVIEGHYHLTIPLVKNGTD